eukprot:310664-Chlamydomonas_euryale.AAC.3
MHTAEISSRRTRRATQQVHSGLAAAPNVCRPDVGRLLVRARAFSVTPLEAWGRPQTWGQAEATNARRCAATGFRTAPTSCWAEAPAGACLFFAPRTGAQTAGAGAAPWLAAPPAAHPRAAAQLTAAGWSPVVQRPGTGHT